MAGEFTPDSIRIHITVEAGNRVYFDALRKLGVLISAGQSTVFDQYDSSWTERDVAGEALPDGGAKHTILVEYSNAK